MGDCSSIDYILYTQATGITTGSYSALHVTSTNQAEERTMILNVNSTTETNCQLASKQFSIKASPIAFDILSSKLYSNPMMAIIRELLTNAYDSHKQAGTLDTPIDVHIPDALNPVFSIRDYGTGLSKEDVCELYTTFFSSTKADTNDFTGCFGLGSKVPFAYTSSFSVQSFYNGVKYYFLATKKDGYPSIIYAYEEPTKEPNGLYIAIPVQEEDFFDFGRNLQEYLQFIPEMKVNTNYHLLTYTPEYERDNITVYKRAVEITQYSYYDTIATGMLLKQGQNIYSLPRPMNDKSYEAIKYLTRISFIVTEVPLGTLAITPNREQLSTEFDNKQKIAEIWNNVEEHLYDVMTKLVCGKEHQVSHDVLNAYCAVLSKRYFSDSEDGCMFKASYNASSRHGLSYYNTDISIYNIALSGMKPALSKNGVIEADKKHETLLIFASRTFSTKNLKLLYNRIGNYEELDQKNIYIILPHLHKLNPRHFVSFMRKLHNDIKTLNSMEENYFNLSHMTLKQFNRRYPNSRKPVIKKSVAIEEVKSGKEKDIRLAVISIGGEYPRISDRYYSAVAVDKAKKTYTPNNTLVLLNEPVFGTNTAKMFKEILDIRTRDGNYVLTAWLRDRYPNIDTTGPNKQYAYVITVCKSNLRYFKEYNKLDKDTMVKEWFAYDWGIANYTNSVITAILCNSNAVEHLIKLQPEKKYRIFNTRNLLKRIALFKAVLSKYNVCLLDNNLFPEELIKQKVSPINFNNLMRPAMDKVIRCVDKSIHKYYAPNQRNLPARVRIISRLDNEPIREITEILMKEHKHVLL